MATSTATRHRDLGDDDLDTAEDHEDFDLDEDEEFDDEAEDPDEDDEDEDLEEDSETEADDEDESESEPAPELRDYYLDVTLEEDGDGSKRHPFNNPACLKSVRLAPGATLYVRSRTTV